MIKIYNTEVCQKYRAINSHPMVQHKSCLCWVLMRSLFCRGFPTWCPESKAQHGTKSHYKHVCLPFFHLLQYYLLKGKLHMHHGNIPQLKITKTKKIIFIYFKWFYVQCYKSCNLYKNTFILIVHELTQQHQYLLD